MNRHPSSLAITKRLSRCPGSQQYLLTPMARCGSRDRAPATAGSVRPQLLGLSEASWVTLTPPTWLGIPAVGIEEGGSQ